MTMEQKLTGIPETLLIPLWARAVESENHSRFFAIPRLWKWSAALITISANQPLT